MDKRKNKQMDDGDKLMSGWMGQFDERKEVAKDDEWIDRCMIT